MAGPQVHSIWRVGRGWQRQGAQLEGKAASQPEGTQDRDLVLVARGSQEQQQGKEAQPEVMARGSGSNLAFTGRLWGRSHPGILRLGLFRSETK